MAILFTVFSVSFLGLFGYSARMAHRLFTDYLKVYADHTAAISLLMEGDEKTSEARFRDLEDLVDRLPSRWEEIKREAARLDSRARYAVKGIRQELADRGEEAASIEELAGELQLPDAERSSTEGVQLVPQSVATEQSDTDWRSIVRQNMR